MASWAPVLGSAVAEEHAAREDGCPPAGHKGSAAGEAGPDRGFELRDDPTLKLLMLAERGLEEAVGVAELPTEGPPAHEWKRAGMPGDGRLVGLVRCLGWGRQLMFGRSATAEGEP